MYQSSTSHSTEYVVMAYWWQYKNDGNRQSIHFNH